MTARDIKHLLAVAPATFVGLLSNFDPDWIHLALCLCNTGGAKTRKRKLPVDLALWLVIGIALLRDRSVAEVVKHLDLVLTDSEGKKVVSPGALPGARRRLGAEAVELLFRLSAEPWSEPLEEEKWNGLSVWAADGTCFNAPNTIANEEAFGRGGNAKSVGPFAQVRAVTLMNARTHVLRDMNFGAYHEGELSLLNPIWEKLPDHSLLLLDRGLQCWWLFLGLSHSGTERHWATLAKSDLACTVVKQLGRGDQIVEVTLSPRSRHRIESVTDTTMQMRRIRVQRRGYMTQFVLTSMVDPKRFPAAEIGALYAERWEIETSYREIKESLLDGEDVLRSRDPAGIRQELWGVAIAYNLVRQELSRVARERGLSPLRLSFRHAVMLVRNFLTAAMDISPGALPKRLARLEADLALLVLPKRRARRCPREVIKRRHRYTPKKRALPSRRTPARPALN